MHYKLLSMKSEIENTLNFTNFSNFQKKLNPFNINDGFYNR